MPDIKHEIIKPEDHLDIFIAYINANTLYEKDTSILTNGIAPHWHRSIEFSYIRKGTVNLWINNQLQKLSQGDFIFVNSGEIHSMTSDNIFQCETIVTIIPYTIIHRTIPNFDTIFFDLYSSKEYDPRFYEIFDFFYEYTQHPQEFDRLKINSFIFELLYILCSKYRSNKIHNPSHHQLQHQILDYIDKYYQNDLTLDMLSDVFHFNPEYLSRKFKAMFGINFKTYLTQYRLQKSLSDLLNTNQSIQYIAINHGFSSVKTYILSFKQFYAITPKQYRLHQKRPK